jgi:hypothetical protein
MTVTTIELHDYVEALRANIPYVHPAGRATIDSWLDEMHNAADRGDGVTFVRLDLRIAGKVEQELAWYAQDTSPREAAHVDGQ